MIAALLLLMAAVNPCAPAAPGRPDPEQAAAYVRAAQSAAASGDTAAERSAWSHAVALDPTDEHARAELQRLCAENEATSNPFADGVKRMKADDPRGAAALFEKARRASPDPATSLLEGICLYEVGEDDAEAKKRLLEARTDRDLAGSADIFLGLIALREGNTGSAAASFETAGTLDATLAPTASLLRRSAAREGKVTVGASLGAGYDSNVDLAPGTSAFPSGSGDALGLVDGRLLLTPWGSSGPFAEGDASYRKLASYDAYDLGILGGGVGYQLSRPNLFASAEYRYDFLVFGAQPYLGSHALIAHLSYDLDHIGFTAEYQGQLESFFSTETLGYSGLRHIGRAGVAWLFDGGSRLELLGFVSRDATQAAQYSYLDAGPELRAFVLFGSSARATASASWHRREYDAIDPEFGVARSDTWVDGRVRAELDVAEHWSLFVSTEARSVASDVPALSYSRLSASAGLLFAAGGL